MTGTIADQTQVSALNVAAPSSPIPRDVIEFDTTLSEFQHGLSATRRYLLRSWPSRHLQFAQLVQFLTLGLFVSLLVMNGFQSLTPPLKTLYFAGIAALISASSFQWMLQHRMLNRALAHLSPQCGHYRLALREQRLLIQAPGYKMQIDKSAKPALWQEGSAHYLLIGQHLLVIPHTPLTTIWLTQLELWVKE